MNYEARRTERQKAVDTEESSRRGAGTLRFRMGITTESRWRCLSLCSLRSLWLSHGNAKFLSASLRLSAIHSLGNGGLHGIQRTQGFLSWVYSLRSFESFAVK